MDAVRERPPSLSKTHTCPLQVDKTLLHLEVVCLLLAQGADMQALTEVADAAVRGCSRASSLCAEAHGAASDRGE